MKLFEYKNNILYYGDCLEVLKTLPNNSIDLCLFDLPYGITNAKWDNVIDLNIMWEQVKRVRKQTTPILLFSACPFDKILSVSNINELRYEWIWEKTQATGFLNAKKMPLKAHETILVFYEKHGIYNPIKTSGHPLKTSTIKHKTNCIKTELYNSHELKDYSSTERYPKTVLNFKTDIQKLNLHSTQKPLDICKYFIETYTNKGDVILDITSGSGTTLVACEHTDRCGIGMENSSYFFNLSKLRLLEEWDMNYPTKQYINKIKSDFQKKFK